MALSHVHRWMRGKVSRRAAAKLRQKASARPRVEALEGRLAPATHVWQGLGNDSNWTTAANWDIGAPNSPDDVLVFPLGALRTSNVNNFASGTQFAEIRLSGGYTISGVNGNRLRVGPGGITSSNVNLIRADLLLTSATIPIHVLDGALQIGNAVGGSISGNGGGIVKDGDGKLVLGRANDFGGAVRVADGVLNIQNGQALGTSLGATTVDAGATLELQANPGVFTVAGERLTLDSGAAGPATLRNVLGGNTWTGQVQLSGNVVIDVTSGPVFLSGSIIDGASPGSLTKEGAGSLEFAGATANTYTGTTTVNAGTLAFNKSSTAFNGAIAGPLVIGDGTGTDTVLLKTPNQIANDGDVTINPSGVFNLNGQNDSIDALTMTGGLVTTGAGELRVHGNLTATSDAAGRSARITGNLALRITSVLVTVNDGPAEVDLDVSARLGTNSTAELVKNGAGRLQLSGANLTTGAITVNAGHLRITNGTALGPAGSAQTEVKSGATLEVVGALNVPENLILAGNGINGEGTVHTSGAGSSFAALNGAVTLAGNTTIRGDTGLAIGGAISGNFDLTKTGAGDLILAGASPNYGGITTIQQGRLIVSNSLALGSSAAGDGTVLQPGTSLVFRGGNTTLAEPFTISGTGADGRGVIFVENETFATLTGPITLAGDARVAGAAEINNGGGSITGAGFLNLAGGISGPFSLTVGGGSVTFSGATANTYTGATRVSGGASLRLDKSPNTNAVPGALIIERDVQANLPGIVTVASPGQIPDAAPVTIDGGILSLNASEAIGPLTLNAGRVTFVPNGVAPDHVLTLAGNVTASGQSVLGGGGEVSLGGATRTFTVAAGGELSVGGILSGTGGLVKAGPGFMQLVGTNTYTGPTTVNQGTLFVSGNLPSPVTVNTGGTLTGNDTSSFFTGAFGNITVAGGTLNPGNDPNGPGLGSITGPPTPAGIMNATGAVSLNAASTLHFDVGGTTPGAGGILDGGDGHDQLKLTGNGSLNLGNALLDLALFNPSFQPQAGQSFVLVQNDTLNPNVGQLTRRDPATGQIQVIQPLVPFTVNGKTFTINYTGGDGNEVILFAQNTPPMVEDLELTPSEVAVGESVVLTGSLTDPDTADELTLLVDWGDGSPEQEFANIGTEPFRVEHSYEQPGDYTVRVTWIDQTGEGNSSERSVKVVAEDEEVPPPGVESVVVNDGSAQRSMVQSLTVTFDGEVTLGDDAFEVRAQDGSLVAVEVLSSVIDGQTVAILVFSDEALVGGSLADGNYTLTIHGDHVTDAAGQALDADGDGEAGGERVDAFFRLFGDGDGDRDVDVADLRRFVGSLGKRQGDAGFLGFFDHDADGDVDRADLKEVVRRFGSRLPA